MLTEATEVGMQHSGSEEAAVIAYPVNSSPSKSMEQNVYTSSIGDSNFADDTVEMSGNFFSQVNGMKEY